MKNIKGSRVPQVIFKIREGGAWKELGSTELFDNKTVIVFALPGAFTPTCSATHLPGYNELAPLFFASGVDNIICLSVNDAFVMQAWQQDQHAEHITFIPDGNGEFSAGLGMLVDKRDLGFGARSWRYSMLVKNGVIEKMFIEPQQPGDPFEVSDAETMLHYINPQAKQPHRITLLSKPGCAHCLRAKRALEARKLRYEAIELGQGGISYSSLKAISGHDTTPQVFIDGQRVGGADELEIWLAAN